MDKPISSPLWQKLTRKLAGIFNPLGVEAEDLVRNHNRFITKWGCMHLEDEGNSLRRFWGGVTVSIKGKYHVDIYARPRSRMGAILGQLVFPYGQHPGRLFAIKSRFRRPAEWISTPCDFYAPHAGDMSNAKLYEAQDGCAVADWLMVVLDNIRYGSICTTQSMATA